MPGEGFEPSCPLRGHPILSRARLTGFATPAPADRSRTVGLVARREAEVLRDLRRGRAERDDDLLVRAEHELERVAEERLPVHPDVHWLRAAQAADAVLAEPHAPDAEELTERVVVLDRRLDVDDPRRVVRVQER